MNTTNTAQFASGVPTPQILLRCRNSGIIAVSHGPLFFRLQPSFFSPAFTLVELLVVIVIFGPGRFQELQAKPTVTQDYWGHFNP